MSEEPTSNADELASATQFRDAVRARLFQMALQAAGIQAWLSTVNLAEVSPGLGIALGVDVLVRKGDLAPAREVMVEIESGAAALPLDSTLCPRCGAGEVEFVGKPDRAGAIFGMIFVGLPRPDVFWTWRCGKCGAEWQ